MVVLILWGWSMWYLWMGASDLGEGLRIGIWII